MSEQIDWSKAPADATHYVPAPNDLHHPIWLKMEGSTVLNAGYIGHYHWAHTYTRGSQPCTDLSNAIARPSTPSWSGEGLPPVGVKVLIMNPEQFAITDYGQEFVGEECTVLAVFVNDLDYRMVAVEKVGGSCCCFISEMCFPIRAPEQIAADEREAAIKEMTAGYAKNSDTLAGWAAYVYDTLGYRKP